MIKTNYYNESQVVHRTSQRVPWGPASMWPWRDAWLSLVSGPLPAVQWLCSSSRLPSSAHSAKFENSPGSGGEGAQHFTLHTYQTCHRLILILQFVRPRQPHSSHSESGNPMATSQIPSIKTKKVWQVGHIPRNTNTHRDECVFCTCWGDGRFVVF